MIYSGQVSENRLPWGSDRIDNNHFDLATWLPKSSLRYVLCHLEA
jgi:hypothetical protein